VRRAAGAPLWLAAVLLVFAAGRAAAAPAQPAFPAPSARVVDEAGLLTPATRGHLEAVCTELAEKTGAEIGVALVPSIAPLDVETYAVRLFERWGVGQKGKDDGVLFVLARDERRVRIEVGYGLEGLLPDGRVGGILRGAVVPSLRADDWNAGVAGGVEALAAIIAADRGVTLATLSDSPRGRGEWEQQPGRRKRGLPIAVVMLIVVIAVILLSQGGGPASPYGRRRGAYWGGMGGGFGSGGGFGGFGGGGGGGGGASSGF
jgi:uncharacterized protein